MYVKRNHSCVKSLQCPPIRFKVGLADVLRWKNHFSSLDIFSYNHWLLRKNRKTQTSDLANSAFFTKYVYLRYLDQFLSHTLMLGLVGVLMMRPTFFALGIFFVSFKVWPKIEISKSMPHWGIETNRAELHSASIELTVDAHMAENLAKVEPKMLLNSEIWFSTVNIEITCFLNFWSDFNRYEKIPKAKNLGRTISTPTSPDIRVWPKNWTRYRK